MPPLSLRRVAAAVVRCRASPRLAGCLAALASVRVVVALGAVAWDGLLAHLARRGVAIPRPRFAHGGEVALPGAPVLLGSYHPSRQNTNTGRLTPATLDAVLARARAIAARGA